MAQSLIPSFRPCKTYSTLLDRHSAALTIYCKAVSELTLLAGKQKAVRFAEAKQDCETCLDDCQRTAAAMRTHKAAHGC